MSRQYLSPLRYPGGKARLAGLLKALIELNGLEGCEYVEPFAGGAGAALELLKSGMVSHIHLNDADRRLYAFWRAVLFEPDRFTEQLRKVQLSLAEWQRQRAVCQGWRRNKLFDIGFAAFYMNRCNRSGVLSGAGPIGGYQQSGKWSLGVRFSRDSLSRRVFEVSKLAPHVSLTNLDALEFLKSRLPHGAARRNFLVYLDPPYVDNGKRLYLNAYAESDHRALQRYLSNQKSLPWVMSYDDCDLIRSLYAGYQVNTMPLQYSLQVKRKATELLIAPEHVALPQTSDLVPVDALGECYG